MRSEHVPSALTGWVMLLALEAALWRIHTYTPTARTLLATIEDFHMARDTALSRRPGLSPVTGGHRVDLENSRKRYPR